MARQGHGEGLPRPGYEWARAKGTGNEGEGVEVKTHLALIMGVVIAGSALTLYAEEAAGAKPAMEKKAALTQSVYVCPGCETMALKAGKCEKCGKDMVQRHLLATKDGQAMLCACGADCKCDAKGIKDGKCACGKEVKMMSCKGMYCCPMGCAELSDKPGKCACGMDMKKVE
jgi:hypothetical protein